MITGTDKAAAQVVIVGGGMAGLACASDLLKSSESVQIVLLEADQQLGGRIKESNHPEFKDTDIGAEFIHGSGTMLTDLLRDLDLDSNLEEIFITSHADGGPDKKPTNEGKYGMYRIEGQLVMYNDEALQPLNQALEDIFETTTAGGDDSSSTAEQTSLLSKLAEYDLDPSLQAIAAASYGNTSAAPLDDLSLAMISRYEKYWEENELEGDFRPPCGMHHVVKTWAKKLRESPRLSIQTQTKVKSIQKRVQDGKLDVLTEVGTVVTADAVVVTVPPPLYKEIDMDLPSDKLEGLSHIGFERIMKLSIKFSHPIWPRALQSVVSSQDIVPEFWFREHKLENTDTTYIAVGYLASKAADSFVHRIRDETGQVSVEKATHIFLQQLADIFERPLRQVEEAVIATELNDWKDNPFVQGGYVYPRLGLSLKHIDALAAPVGAIFFAGEGTNTHACCTIQAAMETGRRASREVLVHLSEGHIQ